MPEVESAPGAPRDLVASVSGTTVVLKWSKSAGGSMPSGYVLEAGSQPGESNLFVSPIGGSALSFTAPNAEAGTYYVRVRASNRHGVSDASNEATVIVGAGSRACTVPPTAPADLRFVVNGSTVVLSWNASQQAPSSYIVETTSGADGTYRSVSDTGSAATSLTEESVAPGTYTVRVGARNACGGSALSDGITIAVR
jgi:hypothetical protein